MRKSYLYLISFALLACAHTAERHNEQLPIEGTWKLLHTKTTRGDSSFTDTFKGKEMIKIINASHFAFLNHDTNHGQDSAASFVAGGGAYELKGNEYVEHLQYCSARGWEDNDFTFTLELKGDTLIQKGKEELAELGVQQEIVETYVRVPVDGVRN